LGEKKLMKVCESCKILTLRVIYYLFIYFLKLNNLQYIIIIRAEAEEFLNAFTH
jgi:hypothetical protein